VKALLITVIGGLLFLPATVITIPIIPEYTKNTSISLAVLFGIIFRTYRGNTVVDINRRDIPILLFCLVSPFMSAVTNDLRVVDGLAISLNRIVEWGIVYWAGRKLIRTRQDIQQLGLAMIVGGLIYVPLGLFEVRMSPQLSNMIYGFFPHSFLQHFRYGGFRPVAFMSHGLMFSLWIATAFTLAYWYLRETTTKRILGVPLGLVATLLLLMGILARSANGWIFIFFGLLSVFIYRKFKSIIIFEFYIYFVFIYIFARTTDVLSSAFIESMASIVFDDERVSSLAVRLVQEQLFGNRAFERPLFGWAWMGRAWPIDSLTGRIAIPMVDSLFIVTLGTSGFFGLIALYSGLLVGPLGVVKNYRDLLKRKRIDSSDAIYPVSVAVVVTFFVIDSLLNAMPNPVYVIASGALVSHHSDLDAKPIHTSSKNT
jgi:hypothetical protein